MDHFGPRGPLLLSAPPAEIEVQETVNAPPVRANRALKVIGWCDSNGCSEGATSWKKHVLHFQSRHIELFDCRSFCTLCLAQVEHYDAHMLSHRNSGVACTGCSASFVNQEDLRKHWIHFHCRSPTETSSANEASPATPVPALHQAPPSSTAAADIYQVPCTSAAPRDEGRAGEAPPVLGWCELEGCPESFPTWERYVDHYLGRHAPTCCPVCLVRHQEPHTELDHLCPRCPARFTSESRQRSHVKSFHSRERVTSLSDLRRVPRDIVGWCTFQRCELPFNSWMDHVRHQRSCHLSALQVRLSTLII